jgi:hypothetical protein
VADTCLEMSNIAEHLSDRKTICEGKMIIARVTKDGKSEVKIDDEIMRVPHDHELAPSAQFPNAWRRTFWVDPRFMSVSIADLARADAEVLLAAERDLMVVADRLPCVAPQLDEVRRTLRQKALERAGADAVTEIEHDLDRYAERETVVSPSQGPQVEDSAWFAGTIGISRDISKEFQESLQNSRRRQSR